MQPNYIFKPNGDFIIEQYDTAKPFASFLPGVAGIDGIPMWSFYVNRGQAMGSFGVKDKDSTIMEFFPAATMYKNVELQGFRTFIKHDGKVHEIFSSLSGDDYTRTMRIEKNVLHIAEQNRTLGLNIAVTYFTMPRESYAAVVRKVEVTSLDGVHKEIEILDGLPQILPFGMGNSKYQGMSNLARAWFDVSNVENHIAFYKLRGSAEDTVEVEQYERGNFYLAFSSESGGLLPPIFDMNVLFGENTALTRPDGWDCPVQELSTRRQVPENKASGGFAGAKATVGTKGFILCTVIGHIAGVELINLKRNCFTLDFVEQKLQEARRLTDDLVKGTHTKTASGLFDQYIDQSYLDNVLRGGWPLVFHAGGRQHVYHLFSRKHGDLEREYNFFSLEPAYYSQGNGNFRDVNQNRRNDVLLKPAVKDFNVRHFMSLIQADGYNPLHVKGCTFTFDIRAFDTIAPMLASHQSEVNKLLSRRFTPGTLISYLADHDVKTTVSREELLEAVLAHSTQNFEAAFGEGYWSDHWTYNMDLIDAYLSVYPDNEEAFLFGDSSYHYFKSPVYVLPRADRYVLANGKVRQYGAILETEADKGEDGCWLKTSKGNVYETNLYAKLLSLTLNKFTALDPCGMGIEMEGGKPGWNDAMNGLPGLFGSGLGETAELLRIVSFLVSRSVRYAHRVALPGEMAQLLAQVKALTEQSLKGALSAFDYWDKVNTAKEAYRAQIRDCIGGEEVPFTTTDLCETLKLFEQKLQDGLTAAQNCGGGLYPTYFTFEATEYELLPGKTNPVNHYQNVHVGAFSCRALPAFLEGPARVLKTVKEPAKAADLYNRVKTSDIYDRKLGMYKTSGSLENESPEIGRLKAFTPGWLEREAVFLHMEYKYLLSMLKAGLYEQFFGDMKTAFVPFLKPETYGRSTLENSSFIASSANPDETVHGRGFVARLSGSTAEVLSIWIYMMCGEKVFSFEEGQLRLTLQPVLPDWLFCEDGTVIFTFLGGTAVCYHNPQRKATFGEGGVKPTRYLLTYQDGGRAELAGAFIGAQAALDVRDGKVTRIDVELA